MSINEGFLMDDMSIVLCGGNNSIPKKLGGKQLGLDAGLVVEEIRKNIEAIGDVRLPRTFKEDISCLGNLEHTY